MSDYKELLETTIKSKLWWSSGHPETHKKDKKEDCFYLMYGDGWYWEPILCLPNFWVKPNTQETVYASVRERVAKEIREYGYQEVLDWYKTSFYYV